MLPASRARGDDSARSASSGGQPLRNLKKHSEYDTRRVAIAILHYLRDHPQAKDSLTGIAQWWVGEERNAVEEALKVLLREGILVKRRHLYQLAANRSVPRDLDLFEQALRQQGKQQQP